MKPIQLNGSWFFPAYDKNGRPGLKNIKTTLRSSGLYFIKENGVVVYIGMTKFNLKKVLYRHFQKWGVDKKKPSKYNVTYFDKLLQNKYEVAVFKIEDTEDNIQRNEIINILHYRPRDNANKYPQYEQAFLNDLQQEGVHVSNDKDLPF